MALKKKVVDNTQVTKGTKSNQTVLKEGIPNDRKKDSTNSVGVSLGLTLNMDNYESLRVDCWLTSPINEGETYEQAYQRVTKIVSAQLEETVSSYR